MLGKIVTAASTRHLQFSGEFDDPVALLDTCQRMNLEGAFTGFAQLGAEPWLAQARSELEACGAIPPDSQAGQYGTLEEAKTLLEKAVVAVKEDKAKALDMFNKGVRESLNQSPRT